MKLRTLIGFLAAVAWLTPPGAPAQVVDGIAAIVGTNIITFAEIREMVLPVERDLRRAYEGKELQDKLKAAALDGLNRLVERQLIIQEFNAKEYKIPESAIEEQLRDVIRKDFGGDKNLLIKTLSAQGMTMSRYREELRNKIIVQAMTHKEVSGEIIISPAKIEKYYREHQDNFKVGDRLKLRMLVVKKASDGEDNAARRKLIEEIHAKLQAGEDFGKLAQAHSEGSNNKEQQGDWGWIERDTLRKELSDAAFALKPGQHSGIIETDDGFYLLRVEEFKAAHVRPLSEVRNDVERKLQGEERQRRQQAWIDKLKAKAFIRIY